MPKSLFSLLSDLPLRKRLGYIALAIVALAVSFYLLAIWSHTVPPTGYETMKPLERFTMVNEKRRTAVQIVGGVFFFVTAYFTFRNLLATEANAKVSREKHDQDRFFKATENLDGTKSLSTRLGAIYTLEQFGCQSRQEQSVVLDVLAAYISKESPKPNELLKAEDFKPIASDIKEAFKAIGYLHSRNSSQKVILLVWCNLMKVSFPDTYAECKERSFHHVIFIDTILFASILNDGDFTRAYFQRCNLREASFRWANCTETTFENCEFENTEFPNAILTGTDLRGADLSTAKGLTQEQVNSARMSKTTQLPPGLELPQNLEEDRKKP